MTLTHVDLFSGIGGFALAARWNGIETIQFVEIDPFCCKVLEKNFPGVPIHEDIKTFTYTERFRGNQPRREDVFQGEFSYNEPGISGATATNTNPFLLTGGFPCQPFSCAGKRRGKEDDRYLWPEMLRVVSEAKPTWIIGENVAGFINMGLDDCISDLEAEGYEVQAFVIPACAVNAPHRRDRVWIVGYAKSGSKREIGGICKGESPNPTRGVESDCHAADTESEQAFTAEQRGLYAEFSSKDSDATDSETTGLERRDTTRTSRTDGRLTEYFDGNERDNETEPWTTPWFEAATRLCGVDARVSNRVDRLKALGNAIVPQVASELMRAILEAEGGK